MRILNLLSSFMVISFVFNGNKKLKTEDFENNFILLLSVYVRRNTGDTLKRNENNFLFELKVIETVVILKLYSNKYIHRLLDLLL